MREKVWWKREGIKGNKNVENKNQDDQKGGMEGEKLKGMAGKGDRSGGWKELWREKWKEVQGRVI